MSLTSRDRNFRAARGGSRAAGESPPTLAADVARALAMEYGGVAARVKVVARLTASNERTVKNWFGGRNGPGGEGLVALMRHSDEVLRAVLRQAGREDLLVVLELGDVRARLREAVAIVDGVLGEGGSASSA